MNAVPEHRARRDDARWEDRLTPAAVWAWVIAVDVAVWFLIGFLIHLL